MSSNKYIRFSVLGIIVSCFTLMILSCNEDEEFTKDYNSNITVSDDTITFDTIFTGIGSATKEFTIYNNNDKGVRLTSVRLGSNGSSGFRVNLDGQYNTQFNDVEIYHKDSLFCFVEVTVNPHDSDSPILLTDSLLFTQENGRTWKVILQAYGQDIKVMKHEVISRDTTLSETRPIVIYDSLVVAKGATLTIKEGTTLCFHKDAGLMVHGTLRCEGTLEKPITFRGDRTDKLFYYLPYDRMASLWEGIYLYPESHDNYFNYTDIHSGNYGIYAEPSTEDIQKCKAINTIVHNVAGDAVRMVGTNSYFANCQISNAGYNCATIIGGTTSFVHCTLAQFYPWNSEHGSALYFANLIDEKEYPLNLIEFKNCIITGNSTDEVYGQKKEDSDAAFNYKFYNTLVNTTITDDDAPNFMNCLFDTDVKDKSSTSSSSTSTEKKDEKIVRGANFRKIDNEVYVYDFRLDTLSTARGLGNGTLTPSECEFDLNGIKRPTDKPDAGCYQFE